MTTFQERQVLFGLDKADAYQRDLVERVRKGRTEDASLV